MLDYKKYGSPRKFNYVLMNGVFIIYIDSITILSYKGMQFVVLSELLKNILQYRITIVYADIF